MVNVRAWVIVPEYPDEIVKPVTVPWKLASIVASFVDVPSKTTESEEVGVVSDDQFAAHDHLLPSPPTPPQVPSVPPPSQVRTAAILLFGINNKHNRNRKIEKENILL